MATLKKTKTRRVFPDAQNGALREALIEMKARKHLSQNAIGQLLDIKQQNVGRLINSDTEGFSHATALRLVKVLGYASTDTFFRARGVATEPADIARSA